MFCKFYFVYRLGEVFTVLEINLTPEVFEFMSGEQFDAKKGPLKIKFKHAF